MYVGCVWLLFDGFVLFYFFRVLLVIFNYFEDIFLNNLRWVINVVGEENSINLVNWKRDSNFIY